jgi:hypothetical protein
MKAFGDTLQGDAKTQWEQDVLMPLQQAGKAAKDRVAAPKAPAQPKPQPAAAATDPNVELAGTPDPVPDEAMEAARAADEAPPAEDLGAMPEEESADVVMGADDPVTYPPPAVVRQPIDPEVIDPLESSATPIGDEIIDAEFEVKAPRADSSPDAETKAADPEATTLTAKQDAAEAASNADASKATNDAESARPLKESEETDATAAKTGKRGGVLGALWRNKGIIGVGAAGLAGYQYLANQRVSEPLADGSPGGSPSGSPAGQAGGAFGGGMAGAGQDAGSGSALWSSSITPEQRIRMLRQMDGTANRKTPQTFYNWRGYE